MKNRCLKFIKLNSLKKWLNFYLKNWKLYDWITRRVEKSLSCQRRKKYWKIKIIFNRSSSISKKMIYVLMRERFLYWEKVWLVFVHRMIIFKPAGRKFFISLFYFIANTCPVPINRHWKKAPKGNFNRDKNLTRETFFDSLEMKFRTEVTLREENQRGKTLRDNYFEFFLNNFFSILRINFKFKKPEFHPLW